MFFYLKFVKVGNIEKIRSYHRINPEPKFRVSARKLDSLMHRYTAKKIIFKMLNNENEVRKKYTIERN